MNQGRLSACRRLGAVGGLLLQALCLAQDVPALPPATPLPASTPLRFAWEQADHASGIYYVKAEAALTVVVDNVSAEGQELAGEILFGSRSGAGDNAEFKIISVTPVARASVGPRQRVKIPLQVTFAAAGSYELRWKHGSDFTPVASATGISLECIFAPRSAKGAEGAGHEESPWLTTLPKAAVKSSGFLQDYIQQTTVRRFLIDERFAYDAATNVGLGFGAATGASAKELDTFFADASKAAAGGAKARFVLRLSMPVETADAKTVSALKEYLADAIRRSRGTLAAIALVPGVENGEAITEAQRRNFVTLYLAGYEAAKRADRGITMLGAGSARATAQWLATDPKVLAYVDAMALADAAADPGIARQLLGERKAPLQMLPPLGAAPWPPAAGAMAQGAEVVAVPAPDVDHGVTAHLLGGSVLLQRTHLAVPTADPTLPETSQVPFIAVFQGDGFAVAAVAGFAAGTDLDAAFPGLAHTRTQVEPVKAGHEPAYPNLEVGDDTRSMRVVDAAGAAVDCRVGDQLYVPAGESVMYVLQAGSADDLAGSLRPGVANNLPMFEVSVEQKSEGATGATVAVRLRNCATTEIGGTLRLISPPAAAGESAVNVAEKEFSPVSPDKVLEVPLTVAAGQEGRLAGPLVVEITSAGARGQVQRTVVKVVREGR